MKLMPKRPWQELRSLKEELDSLFERIFGREEVAVRKEFVPFPAVDMEESEDEFIVKAELPGMDRKDIQVELVGNTLVIKGEKRREAEEHRRDYHRTERYYGSFYRSIPLPLEVATDKIHAKYRDGVLEVVLPKSEEAKRRTVRVRVE